MFRVLRNEAPSGTELLHALEQELRSTLPPGWGLKVSREPAGRGGWGADLVLELRAPDRATGRIIVEAKSNIEPRDVQAVLRQLARYGQASGMAREPDQGRLVVAPYLSPRARELLADSRTGWYDATGNIRVQLDRPVLFVERRGADRNPYTSAKDRRLRSLRGPGAARVVRSLLDDHVPIGCGCWRRSQRSVPRPAHGCSTFLPASI
jgi:hypothetical protein